MGLALTVHHDTRNKKLMDLLSAKGYCIPYKLTLLMETAIAKLLLYKTLARDSRSICTTILEQGCFYVLCSRKHKLLEGHCKWEMEHTQNNYCCIPESRCQWRPVEPSLKIGDT
jgi:hypothetical protein